MKIVIFLLKPLLISCRQAAELMSSSLDTRPGVLTRLKIVVHGILCPPCEYLRKQFLFIDALLHHDHEARQLTLPEEIKKNIKQQLKAHNNT